MLMHIRIIEPKQKRISLICAKALRLSEYINIGKK